ncbi:hypothetical protein [Dactylosporangium sp. NPDC050588]|uniref:hypothetical protein n=1 Tax=Dactylosporangium sp. NPDC050588 TaxID=3157211 RepID=UPI00340FBDC5
MRRGRWVFAISAWAVCTTALSVVGIDKVESIRSSMVAATSGGRPSAAASPSSSPSPGSTQMLPTPGGTVAAHCNAGLTWADYLRPATGFHIEDAQQGPAAEYRVTFKTNGQEVRVVVHCDPKTLLPTTEVTLG